MKYRKLGETGLKVSLLGFGCMRLPTIQPGISEINESKAIELIRKSIDKGVNYVDSGYLYHGGKSEIILGKALKDGYRDSVYIETKLLLPEVHQTEDFNKLLEIQCGKLGVERIDVYLFHGLSWDRYKNIVLKYDLIEQAKLAKKVGKIGHIGFSSHDSPENIKKMIDTGFFEVMLVQYNILDQKNHEVIDYASEMGLGVNIMGPNAGGRLALSPPEKYKHLLTLGRQNFIDIALDFVWSNQSISCALSGMNTEKIIEDNIHLASLSHPSQTGDGLKHIHEIQSIYKKGADITCTGCSYCLPCPQDVNIPFILRQLFNTSTDAISWEIAKINYNLLGKPRNQFQNKIADENWEEIGLNPNNPGNNVSSCVQCGLCEEKCPQIIPIREKLQYTHEILTKFISYNQ